MTCITILVGSSIEFYPNSERTNERQKLQNSNS